MTIRILKVYVHKRLSVTEKYVYIVVSNQSTSTISRFVYVNFDEVCVHSEELFPFVVTTHVPTLCVHVYVFVNVCVCVCACVCVCIDAKWHEELGV